MVLLECDSRGRRQTIPQRPQSGKRKTLKVTRAAAARPEIEQRFGNLADAAPVMIWVSGPDKLCTFFNKAWLVFTGRTLEQEAGNGWADGVHPDDLDRCFAIYSSSFDARQAFQMEYRLRRADGVYRWVLDHGAPLFESGQVFRGYIGSCVDITDVKRMQEEAMARQKLESLGVLAGGIAHDFNNLLGSILSEAELALSDTTPNVSPERELRNIRALAVRGSEIARELLTFAGNERENIEPVNLSALVGEMLELLRISISKHATLKVELGEDLPAVRASAAQIRRVVMNLITNASEAIGDQGGVITVTASIARAQPSGLDYVGLEISDTGCGMTEELQASIFDPFFTTRQAGRGLGLAVVQGIIRGYDGSIHVRSVPGQGTTFRILLPCAGEPALENRIAAIPGKSDPPERIPGRAPTILVVDDEVTLRRAISKMLDKRGFFTLQAEDGSSAIELFRARPDEIDVILLDMTIPGTSSTEVVSEVRKVRADVKVILTTAYSYEFAMRSFGSALTDSFIQKPYQFSDLLKVLTDTLSR
jgi:two-component system cell cycle sensor histidine kinase/response regulator CckA